MLISSEASYEERSTTNCRAKLPETESTRNSEDIVSTSCESTSSESGYVLATHTEDNGLKQNEHFTNPEPISHIHSK